MSKYKPTQILRWDVNRQSPHTGRWVPARSENYRADSLWTRLRLAWGVLIGRYDALDWDE